MPDPFYTWRTGRAYPGDTLYFWSPTRHLKTNPTSPTYTVPTGWQVLSPSRYNNPYADDFYNQWLLALKIPADATAGTYTVSWTDPVPPGTATLSFNVVVVAPPTPTPM